MPDQLERLFAEVDDARGRSGAAITLAVLTAVSVDGLTGEARGLTGAGAWTAAVRLWQPKFVAVLPHIHAVESGDTGSALSGYRGLGSRSLTHSHTIPETETGEDMGHTPALLYEVGDRGLLLQVGGGAPLFLGGLPQ